MNLNLLRALIAGLLGTAPGLPHGLKLPQGKGQPGLRHVIGAAKNWPGKNAGKRKARRDAKRGDQGQRPKFAKARKHTPYMPSLTDEHGVFTWVGQGPRRKWLAGISAQRGY